MPGEEIEKNMLNILGPKCQRGGTTLVKTNIGAKRQRLLRPLSIGIMTRSSILR